MRYITIVSDTQRKRYNNRSVERVELKTDSRSVSDEGTGRDLPDRSPECLYHLLDTRAYYGRNYSTMVIQTGNNPPFIDGLIKSIS